MPRFKKAIHIHSLLLPSTETKKNISSILLIIIFSISLSLPLVKSGLYTMHDDQQVARLFLFSKSLTNGQFPVRWVDELGFGFGYPLFVFYPPLVYILGEVTHIVGFNFINSVKIVFFLSILLSGVSMFVFVKELWGRAAAIIASIFYIYAPYRALDIYIRGAFAEAFSFVWLPLILWSFYKVSKEQTAIYFYLSGILLAFLMITHNLIFLPFMLILGFYLPVLCYISKNKILFIKHTLFVGILGAGLSAFFWMPALLEKKYTIVDQLLLTNLADYRIHFVYPQQLWNWPWGFGGSAKGLADGISFKIGKIHIILSVISFLLMVIYYKYKILTKNKFVLPVTFLFLFIFSGFMTTMYSQFIWNFIKPLAYLQFPWRFLTFAVLFSSLMAGYFIYLLRLPFLKLIFSGIILVLLIVPNYKLFKPQLYRENLTDAEAILTKNINWGVSKSSFEYMTQGVDLMTLENGSKMLNIDQSNLPKEKLSIISGDANVEITTIKPDKLNFKTTANNNSFITANIINFPGWELKIDSIVNKIYDNNSYKLISFSVPSGNHIVSLDFKNTPTITIANMISLVSIISLLTGLLIINISKLRFKL